MTDNKGYSLIELILTMAIFMLLVIPALGMVFFSSRTNYLSEQTLTTSFELQSIMEEIKGCDYFMGLYTDGELYPFPRNNEIRYCIEPIESYQLDDKILLYRITLQKVGSNEVVHEMIGSKPIQLEVGDDLNE